VLRGCFGGDGHEEDESSGQEDGRGRSLRDGVAALHGVSNSLEQIAGRST
jgi:hypothetical protein